MAHLVVERAGIIVERKQLDNDQVSIGRAPTSDIVLDDPQIGSSLAVVKKEGATWVLEDQGSMTGVSHQNERVSKLTLRNGMRFEAFPFSFIFEDEGSVLESSSDRRLEATEAMDMSIAGEGAKLVCVNGPFGPFDLKPGVNIVGRKPGLDISLDHKMVSKEHAHVLCLPGEFIVEDRGAVNGTFVNKSKITKATIRHGDVVQFGQLEFKLVTEGAGQSQVSPAAGRETADIEVPGVLLGGALDKQAATLGKEPEGKGKKKHASASGKGGTPAGEAKKGGRGLRLALIGCLTLVLLVLALAVAMTGGGGGGHQTPPPGEQPCVLKLKQATGILDSRENLDKGVELVDEVLAGNCPEKVKTDAKALKDKIQKVMLEPKPLEKMTQEELRDAANSLVSKGSILESVRYYERLVTLDPNWTGGSDVPCGVTYSTLMYQIGLIYEGAGNREMAMQVWKREQTVLPEASQQNVPHAKIRDRIRVASGGGA